MVISKHGVLRVDIDNTFVFINIILTALLLSYLVCSCAEEKPAEKRIDDTLRPPPIIVKSSQAPPSDSSYFSKITNWLQSFGNNEKKTSIYIPPGLPLPPPGPSSSHHGPPAQINKPSSNYGPPQTFGQTVNNGPVPSHGPSAAASVNINHGPPVQNHVSGTQTQGTSNSHKYLPPNSSANNDKDCNPCNQEPWVPIAGNYGSKTVIGFVPHSDLNKGKLSGAYGPPNRPSKEYGPPPSPPSNQYGPPVSTPNNQYGPPPSAPSNLYEPPKLPSSQYGLPNLPNQEYSAPPNIPSKQYGGPASAPSNQYGPPPSPPNNQYGPPLTAPSNQYGPPSLNHGASQSHGLPSSQYGPPNNIQDVPPPKLSDKPPSNNYGPPSLPSIKYGPPKHKPPHFLPTPIPHKYGPPFMSHNRRPRPHLPPPPSAFMGPPPPSTKYGPPSSDFGSEPLKGFETSINSYIPPPSGPAHGVKPFSNYGAPSNGFTQIKSSASSNTYGPPPPISAKPSNEYGPPQTFRQPFESDKLSNNYGSPQSALPTIYSPPSSSGSYGTLPGPGNQYLPPFPTPTVSAVSPNFIPPSNHENKFNNNAAFVTPLPHNNIQTSYGPPSAGPVPNHNGKIKITSEEYLPPPQELPISNGHDDHYEALKVPPIAQSDSSYTNNVVAPIPFPNMSPTFILPIKNAHPFRNHNPSAVDNLSSQGSNIPIHTGTGGNIQTHGETNVHVSQSLPVADFLSSVEYPPNVVQSPLIDLVVNDNTANLEETQDYGEQKGNNNGYQINLRDNPIVVDGDEHHQEASDNHAAVAVHDGISTKLTFSPNILNSIDDVKPTAAVQTILGFKNKTNVQIDPSLQTLLHDENLAGIIAKQLLSENSNPPKPFEVSENSPQKSLVQVNQNAQATNNALFTQPTIDYSNWNPSIGGLSTGMQPPAPSQTSWINTNNYVPFTTKKPKQIQIIVPYTTNNKGSNWHQKDSRNIVPSVSTSSPYNPTISLFGKLPSAEESQWTKYIDHNFQESKTNIAQTPSPISNIQDFFKDATVNIDASHRQNLPFDILKLQQNIDVWTEQEFNKMRFDTQSSTTSRFAYSKKIPDEYLTTQSINLALNEVTTSSPNSRNSKLFHHDYLASSSVHHSVEARPQNLTELANIDNKLLETNLIGSDASSTQKAEVTPATWDKIQVSISPLTNERVYVVTPLPWERNTPTPKSAWTYVPKNEIQQINKKLADNANFVFNSPRFAVRPEPVPMNKSKEDVNNKIHLVYSDWPELINSLATTTTGVSPSTTGATPHPLLGRMDISEHTQAPARQEGTVQTYTGHSKVVTGVTASSITKKRTGIEDKKFTTTSKPAASDKT